MFKPGKIIFIAMKKTISCFCIALLSTGLFVSCGGSNKEEETTEAAPSDKADFSEDGSPAEVLNKTIDNRLQVVMENVGESDTTASSISGYIDSRNAPVSPAEMTLYISAAAGEKVKGEVKKAKIEKDGRVPGIWVPSNSYCRFTLAAARDTFRFETRVEEALYRFKIQFKGGI